MALLDTTIVNVAVPTIRAELGASGAALQLVIGGYAIAYSMLLITGARLGDIHGRRRVYLAGVAIFAVSSLVCGLAPNIGVLIAARLVQGAAAAMTVPQVMSIIQLRFTGQARAVAFSAYSAVMSVGMVLGLVVGGVLVNADLFGTSWRPIFMVNVPIAVVILALLPRLLPADAPAGSRRLDVSGLAVSLPAVSLVVAPLVLGREYGWPAWTFAAMAAGVGLLVVLVGMEQRIRARGGDPLIDVAVLRRPGLALGITTQALLMAAFAGFLFTFSLHLQAGLGDTALRTGMTLAPMAVVFGAVGFSWARLPAAVQHLLPAVALALCTVGYLGLVVGLRNGSQTGPALWVALSSIGAGLGLGIGTLVTHSVRFVPPAQVGDASGLLMSALQLAGVVGVAAIGGVFLAHDEPGAVGWTRAISTTAMSTTAWVLAAAAAAGVVAAAALARSIAIRRRAEAR
jgi:MFS family permease